MKQSYNIFMGLAMLLTLGFAGGTVLTATPANALIIFQCPDGSTPPDFQCPEACDTIACPTGQECQIQNNAPVCVPTLTCANVLCTVGNECVETAAGPQCVPVEPTITCANILCTADSQCIETVTGPRCVPVIITPVYPTCEELACSGSTQCKTIAGRARCVPVSGGSSSSPFNFNNTFNGALGDFNTITSGGSTNPNPSNSGSNSSNVGTFNTFQGAQNQFNFILNQQQQACVASGKTWTGSFCKFW